MPAHLIEMSGKRFGFLTVLERAGSVTPAKWLCRCDCGQTTVKDGFRLRRGVVKSCGCATSTMIANSRWSHGMTGSRLEYIRRGMIARCHNPKRKDFARYGGRGIYVCTEWLNNPKAFYEWATENGYQDSLSIDRIDHNGGYCPSNCRWIPLAENVSRANRSRRMH